MIAILRPLDKPLPQVAYDKGKEWMKSHPIIHYFFHQLYCRWQKNWKQIPWRTFRERHTDFWGENIKTVQMIELPSCQHPNCNETAEYDSKTIYGPWGYFCKKHFKQIGVPPSTRLEKRVKIAYKVTQKQKIGTVGDLMQKRDIKTVFVPLMLDSPEVKCPYCNEPRTVEIDANYTVTCESCDNKFRVVSPI